MYRPATSEVFVINELGTDGGGLGSAEFSYVFGNPGDVPFVGDFDGDGIDTVGLHRTMTGQAYFRNSHSSGVADLFFRYGDPGDRILAGNWIGSGTDTVATYRRFHARFFLRYSNSTGIADEDFPYGSVHMLPVAGRFGLAEPAFADRTWTINTVDGAVDWGRFASIGFDGDGRALISHGADGPNPPASQLAVTRCVGVNCAATTTSLLPVDLHNYTSLGIGPLGEGVIIYNGFGPDGLGLVRCSDAMCATAVSTIADGSTSAGVLGSLIIGRGPLGLPFFVYLNASPDFATGAPQGLYAGGCLDTNCTVFSKAFVFDAGDFDRFGTTSGADGLPVIVHYGLAPPPGDFGLRFARCADELCTTSTNTVIKDLGSTFNALGHADVTIGGNGAPLIAFTDKFTEELYVAHCADPACTSSTIALVDPGPVGDLSMTTGVDGMGLVAYYDAATRDLNVAHCRDPACSSIDLVTIDTEGDVGRYASLEIDPFGMPMIAYSDLSNGDLKVARLGG